MAGPIDFLDDGSGATPPRVPGRRRLRRPQDLRRGQAGLGDNLSEAPCIAAGVFTTNAVRSPFVNVCQEHLSEGPVRALVVNTEIANTCVGEQGYSDAKQSAALTAGHLGLRLHEVLTCSAGVIGVELPMWLISAGIKEIAPFRNQGYGDGGHGLARAVMTTDTRPRKTAVFFEVDGRRARAGRTGRKGVPSISGSMSRSRD